MDEQETRDEREAALERYAELAKGWDYDAWLTQHEAEKLTAIEPDISVA